VAMEIKFTYQEPVKGKEIQFGLIPISELEISPYQRDLSQTHVNNLMQSISSIGFVDPLVVYKENDKYYVINGQHRLEALKSLITDENQLVSVVIIPKEDALAVLKLNIEKAPLLKDKAVQSLKVYQDLVEKYPDESEINAVSSYIEEPILITFGYVYKDYPRFAGTPFYNILKKVDVFLDESLNEANEIRKRYAQEVKEAYNLFVEARKKFTEYGIKSLEATQLLGSLMNPYKKQRNIEDDFITAVNKIKERLNDIIVNTEKYIGSKVGNNNSNSSSSFGNIDF